MADSKRLKKTPLKNGLAVPAPEDAGVLTPPQETVYRLHNLDCADCAKKFENMVKKIPGVVNAQVYFSSAKLKVVGNVGIQALREVGSFENIEVFPEGTSEGLKHDSGSRFDRVAAVASGAALLIGWMIHLVGFPWENLFFLAAIVIGGFKTFRKGFNNAFKLHFDMSVLMSVAVLGAVLIGEWTEGATVAFLFAVSGLLESYTADKARHSLRTLMDMTPKVATLIEKTGEREIPIDEVQVDDEVLVKPGERIPIDGIVLEGHTDVNQAPITGESVPVSKGIGSEVFAGTINQTGAIKVRVTKENSESTLAKIIQLVDEAQNKKVTVQSFIDRFSYYYTPVVIALAALIILIPPLFFGQVWHEWIYRGLALLVVACPCALVITTPVVIVSAIANAAKNGVLIKGGIHLERLGEVNVAAFDKTGTLTKGLPYVYRVVTYQGNSDDVLTLAGSVERFSEHPLGDAILREAKRRNLKTKPVRNFLALPGKGAHGEVNGDVIKVGNKMMFPQSLPTRVQNDLMRQEEEGNTVVMVGKDNDIFGLIVLTDEIRKESLSVIRSLKKMGIKRTVMLTGDSPAAAGAIAQKIGVDTVLAGMLPQEKVTKIQKLKNSRSVVMMVGDGINDAPALAAADVSIAMGVAGTDAALEAADIALMADDLGKLPFAVELSRQSIKVIKQNIGFALGIKVLALLAVFPGWLTLWVAIMADMGANVLVTLNGMRLVRYKRRLPEKMPEVACTCSST